MMLTDDPATVILNLYRIRVDGAPEAYFRVTLQSAQVVAVAPHVAGGGVTAATTPHLESVAFSYGLITWEHLTCGTTYTSLPAGVP
jgi:type VI secretion system Hcp family effector